MVMAWPCPWARRHGHFPTVPVSCPILLLPGKQDMSPLQGCCTLCSILMLVGGNLGVLVKIHQDSINGTEGQSVLLPVSYRFDGAPGFPMKIVWYSSNMWDELVTCTVLNCSLGAGGAPSSCSARSFYLTKYRGRTKFFPENGSLLLSDLQLSDSGVYSVAFNLSHQTFHITLTVHERRSTAEHPGGNLGVLVKIHQDSINGTEGQSVLLPVSYRFDGAPGFPMKIVWYSSNMWDELVTCTVLNCSLGAGGAPSSCSARSFYLTKYRGRTKFFPENGSLLLSDLQLSDSGVYSVAFKPSHQTWYITLTVHEQPPTPTPDPKKQEPTLLIGICSSVSLLLLFLLFCCIRHWGAARQQKRRIIKQQQVSSVEESHMESTVLTDMATIYARIGDSFEQSRQRPTPEVMYTSLTPPAPPRQDTGLYHLLV
ncbi:uncharacterized protein LOC115333486 [Aquila chrysaetos chrysaetos]|uniref:uncharacterized protein LOC115333486 n=1 Tax=Aquila chrysaetos chrysaetos TaxID=223781 RepID=UPI001B7D475D|nr:uncharacterized protein LOC115333486 [Aquila chrysaetos chrysaetos]